MTPTGSSDDEVVRAGIFIGVDRTGGLQKLADAAAGAKRMHAWATGQGMADGTHAKLITDAGGAKVHPDMIYDAIKELVDGAGVQQLILYFAGHGVNINRGEHWLLTDAPAKTSAAVNVSGSVELARYCGIQHVVIVSDACRVAAEGIQAQNVRGVDVFPNEAASDRARPVDQFFACFLGRTAAELRDPASAASTYSALYTGALLDGLSGTQSGALEASGDADGFRYVRPRTLQRYLEAEVPRRVKSMALQQKVNQNPDAIITSDGAWLARVAGSGAPAEPPVKTRGMRRLDRVRPESPPDLRTLVQRLVSAAIVGDFERVTDLLQKAANVPGGSELGTTVRALGVPFTADSISADSAIVVRGARIASVMVHETLSATVNDARDGVSVGWLQGRPASVVLELEGGMGCVIPAIPDYIAMLSIDDGELIDVTFEPVPGTSRYKKFAPRRAEMHALRAVAAAASRDGRFRPGNDEADELGLAMQYGKSVDPALSLYAAYAWHDLHGIERIRSISQQLRHDVGSTFFDLELLGRGLMQRSVRFDDAVVPFIPMLSRGWALLGAHRVALHPALHGIEESMRESVWALFDRDGTDKLKRTMQSGDVR